jgi:hypothetical protein
LAFGLLYRRATSFEVVIGIILEQLIMKRIVVAVIGIAVIALSSGCGKQ